ncbi:hypothetical protein F441_13512 [Phytophthora nicotianae CJ01A1]|uniref:Uncharacterized protein n=1 Tax=Phytophthora nicotianae CJ01A1 TaxID=1317063 RepID=W2WK46_PHYNI|nr:hypothetical protein F441_13512 [Phytophthora nicotianae CJ01A1]
MLRGCRRTVRLKNKLRLSKSLFEKIFMGNLIAVGQTREPRHQLPFCY